MKLPRDLSGDEIVRALRRLGFVVVRQVGSHLRLERDPIRVTVPAHSSAAPGTLKSTLRQPQVTIEKLLAAL